MSMEEITTLSTNLPSVRLLQRKSKRWSTRMQLISTGRSKGGHVKRGKEDERSLLYGVENFAFFFFTSMGRAFPAEFAEGPKVVGE